MAATVLFAGNGVNTINQSKSWESLLHLLHSKYFDPVIPFSEVRLKPFPLVYEQIVLWQLKKHKNKNIEAELKKLIAFETGNMELNPVHRLITASKSRHIITANYEFNLTGQALSQLHNDGCIKETAYSIFRNFNVAGKTYWHLHGDAQHTYSINLGYEHYCGQLQRMREYATGFYTARNKALADKFKRPLVNRSYLQTDTVYSWIDFFFKDNTSIKIFGLRLDLEEIDLWWLLIYRAKIMYGASAGLRIPKNNKLQYFIPREFTIDKKRNIIPAYKTKKALMEAMNIDVIELDIPHGEAFYAAVLQTK